MTGITEEQIRDRAHLIWEREGRPEGRGAEHWDMATAELVAEATASDAVATETADAPAATETVTAEPEAKAAPKKRAPRAPKADGEAAPKRAPARPRAKKVEAEPSA